MRNEPSAPLPLYPPVFHSCHSPRLCPLPSLSHSPPTPSQSRPPCLPAVAGPLPLSSQRPRHPQCISPPSLYAFHTHISPLFPLHPLSSGFPAAVPAQAGRTLWLHFWSFHSPPPLALCVPRRGQTLTGIPALLCSAPTWPELKFPTLRCLFSALLFSAIPERALTPLPNPPHPPKPFLQGRELEAIRPPFVLVHTEPQCGGP